MSQYGPSLRRQWLQLLPQAEKITERAGARSSVIVFPIIMWNGLFKLLSLSLVMAVAWVYIFRPAYRSYDNMLTFGALQIFPRRPSTPFIWTLQESL